MAGIPESSNRASCVFRSMDDVIKAIDAARTLGMRDVAVYTKHHRAVPSDGFTEYEPAVTEYHVELRMIDLDSSTARTLAHVADFGATVENARTA